VETRASESGIGRECGADGARFRPNSDSHGWSSNLNGELTAAAWLTGEMEAIKEATGSGLSPYADMGIAAFRGDETRTLALIRATLEEGWPSP
jgi:hypothetical protein